jgi:DNA-binding response OmpR family regulator
LERVWGHDFYGEDRVVDVHLGHIRKKIEPDPAKPQLIVTVRGVGYRFEDTIQ